MKLGKPKLTSAIFCNSASIGAAGKIDCTPLCCYADSTAGEIIVLCP